VRLVELSASDCKRLWKDLCCNIGKEDLARCTISCPLRSKISWLCACRRLTERNKEEELVDIAPGWG
jgi:hypothetical protein